MKKSSCVDSCITFHRLPLKVGGLVSTDNILLQMAHLRALLVWNQRVGKVLRFLSKTPETGDSKLFPLSQNTENRQTKKYY